MQKTNQEENSDLTLLNYLECELKGSKTLEEFKHKLSDVKAIIEASEKVRELSKEKAVEYCKLLGA